MRNIHSIKDLIHGEIVLTRDNKHSIIEIMIDKNKHRSKRFVHGFYFDKESIVYVKIASDDSGDINLRNIFRR